MSWIWSLWLIKTVLIQPNQDANISEKIGAWSCHIESKQIRFLSQDPKFIVSHKRSLLFSVCKSCEPIWPLWWCGDALSLMLLNSACNIKFVKSNISDETTKIKLFSQHLSKICQIKPSLRDISLIYWRLELLTKERK